MKALKLKHYSDPGHGWVAVKRGFIEALGLAGVISEYSFQKGQTVYLEEDRDANIVLNALKATGVEVSIESKSTKSIRSYPRYKKPQGAF